MKHFAVLLLFSLKTLLLSAQDEQTATATIFEKLTAVEAVELTLETDLTTLVGQKKTNNYLPGVLRSKDGKSYSIEVRARGRYRRKMSQITPMKIKFNKKELSNESLLTFNEIKIALPTTLTDQGNELIVKEYLVYRMFEKISDRHFRARLVKLSLKDTHEKGSGTKKVYAIFIEDEEEVAARLNGVAEVEYGVRIEKLEQQQAALVAMFQYLIGNTDWDFSMRRNVELIKLHESGKLLALPYDFDFCGLVSAPYASPSSESGVKTVRDRYLMATGLDDEALKAATKLLKAHEKDLYQICRCKHISKAASSDMVKFLEAFFKNMEGKELAPTVMAEKRE